MANTTSKKKKASIAKPFAGKTMPGDKISGLWPEICFGNVEGGYNTEEVEEAKILVAID